MFGLIGVLLVVLSTIFIYRTAKQNGHNVGLWTTVSILAGIALEFVIPLAAGVIMAIVLRSSGKSATQIQDDILTPVIILSVVCLILNLVVVVLIMKKISLVTDEKLAEPPPPDEFKLYR